MSVPVTEGVTCTGAPIRDTSTSIPEFDSNAICEAARVDGGSSTPMLGTFAATPCRKIHGGDSSVACAVARGDGRPSAPVRDIVPAAPCCKIPDLKGNTNHESVRGDGGSRAPSLGAVTAAPWCKILGSDSDAICEFACGDGGSSVTSAWIRYEEGTLAMAKKEDGIALTPPMRADPTKPMLTPNAETMPHATSPRCAYYESREVLAKATLYAVCLPGRSGTSTSNRAEWA
jgi:hypothetical protein